MIDIVNVGYDSTNYYVLGQNSQRLLVDVGWPGTLPKLLANLKRKNISPRQIGYLLATHYHPDHAGLAQELKDQGVRLVVLESQIPAIGLLKSYMKPSHPFVDITLHDNVQITLNESRAFLASIGIPGGIISTPGHSDDSVSLILDDGCAFTGDLPLLAPFDPDACDPIGLSWKAIRSLKAKMIYPGHGPERRFP